MDHPLFFRTLAPSGCDDDDDPGVLLKDPGVLSKDPGVLLTDPGVLFKDPFAGAAARSGGRHPRSQGVRWVGTPHCPMASRGHGVLLKDPGVL